MAGFPHIGAYVPYPTVALAATQTIFVGKGSGASDSNDGLTAAKAKATLAGAITALGWNPSDPAVIGNPGVIKLLYGTFTSSSTGNRRNVGITAGSNVVSDPTCTSADEGAWVVGQYITGNTYITAVNPGVSFTLNQVAPVTTTATVIVTHPVLALPPGVTLEGLGSTSGNQINIDTPTLVTSSLIQDNGTGISILTYSGAGGNSTLRMSLEGVAVWGNPNNMFGLYNTNGGWFITADDCDFSYHGRCGLSLDGNKNSNKFNNCTFWYNGTATATLVTGGVLFDLFSDAPSSSNVFQNCIFFGNYGFGVAGGDTSPQGADGVTLIDCQFNYTLTSSLAGSGIGCWLNSRTSESNLSNAFGCGFYGPCVTNLQCTGPVAVTGCSFGGPTNTNNVVLTTTGGARFESCYFTGASGGYSIVTNGLEFSWADCVSSDTNWANDGFGINLPASAASGKGRVPQTTTLNGTTAGSIRYWQEESGTYKKVILSASGYENTTTIAQTITFPIQFSQPPTVVANGTGMTLATSTTTLTLPASMGAAATGSITVEGV